MPRWYLSSALGVLIAVDQLPGYVFVVLAPEISAGVGWGLGGLATVAFLRSLAVLVAALALIGRGPRRIGGWLVAGGAAWAGASLLAGSVTAPGALTAAMVGYGAATAVLLLPALSAPIRLVGRVGNPAAAAFVGVVLVAGATWQGAFVVAGLVCLAAAVFAMPLAGRTATLTPASRDIDGVMADVMGLTWARRVVVAVLAVGLLEVPLYVYLFAHLHAEVGLGPEGRAWLIAALELFGVLPTVALAARRRQLLSMPAGRLLRSLAATLVVGGVAVLGAAVAPDLALATVALFVATAALGLLVPVLLGGALAMVRRAYPGWAPDLATVCAAGAALLSGALAAGALAGTGAALAVMAAAGLWPAGRALAAAAAADASGVRLTEVVGPAVDADVDV